MKPNPQFPADLVIFTEEIFNGKIHFCTVWVCNIYLPIKLFVLAPKDLLEDFLDLLEDNSYLKSSANYWKYGTGI